MWSPFGERSKLAMSRRPGLNELACVRFAGDFGRDNVFVLSSEEETVHEKHKVSGEVGGRKIFSGELSIDDLIDHLNEGAKVQVTELTSEFGLDRYVEEHPDNLFLFAIDTGGQLRFPVPDEELRLGVGWTVVDKELTETAGDPW